MMIIIFGALLTGRIDRVVQGMGGFINILTKEMKKFSSLHDLDETS